MVVEWDADTRTPALEFVPSPQQLSNAFFNDIGTNAYAHLLQAYDFDVDTEEIPSIDELLGIEGIERAFSESFAWAKWRFAYTSLRSRERIGFDLTIIDEKNEITLRLLPGDRVVEEGVKEPTFQAIFMSTDEIWHGRKAFPTVVSVSIGGDKSVIFAGMNEIEVFTDEGEDTIVQVPRSMYLARNKEGIYEFTLGAYEVEG